MTPDRPHRSFSPVLAPAVLLVAGVAWAQDPARSAEFALQLTGGQLPVTAHWEPIADGTYHLYREKGLAQWFANEPAATRREYTAEAFVGFLPPAPVAVGAVWRLAPGTWLPFLQQFHAGATTRARWGSGVAGGHACLRAVSDELAEIVFRVHGRFELVKDKAWLTPAQFAGSLLIDRKTHAVAAFSFALPPRNSNADINAKKGENVLADIVYVPRMELSGGEQPAELRWSREIPLAEARELLAREFYAFERIDWVPFAEVEAGAARAKKSMHIMVLFGSLDDESC